MENKILIVGAGAAGLMAAYAASLYGTSCTLLERNKHIGRKMLITGKGRCNITNAGDKDNFFMNLQANASFMHSAFSKFDNQDVIAFFESNGLGLKIERGARVFPKSDRAVDVVRVFEQMLREKQVQCVFGARVTSIETLNDAVCGVKTEDGNAIEANQIIIATGGLSYPQTGSSGDGYALAKSVGHQVTPLFPALVGLKTAQKWVKECAGLTLKNVGVTVKSDGKPVYSDFGELLFTHVGVSGPTIISASSQINRRAERSYDLLIDLKPALPQNVLDDRLLRDLTKYANKTMHNALTDLLPQRLIPIVLNESGIDRHTRANNLNRLNRQSLLKTLKALPLTITGTEGYEHAVVTAGGVDISGVSPKTMQSKLIKGLYFAGEVLDLDGYTGGYNLQIAFSTGWLAGHSAALGE